MWVFAFGFEPSLVTPFKLSDDFRLGQRPEGRARAWLSGSPLWRLDCKRIPLNHDDPAVLSFVGRLDVDCNQCVFHFGSQHIFKPITDIVSIRD